jgi:hypothetical protein
LIAWMAFYPQLKTAGYSRLSLWDETSRRRLNLFAGHAGKPFEKITHRCAVLQILKQRRHRHARALEEPRAADFAGDALNRSTFIPIQHE